MNLYQWAAKWGVGLAAVHDLERVLGVLPRAPLDPDDAKFSESHVQSVVRLEAAAKGVLLWRNNVGALRDERGVPVRYGLANDSKALNAIVKSADLIGIRPITITPAHVGHRLGQFVSREVKAGDWVYTDTERERAQRAWAELITAKGGDACFATGPGSL